jgi:hypothetical protein
VSQDRSKPPPWDPIACEIHADKGDRDRTCKNYGLYRQACEERDEYMRRHSNLAETVVRPLQAERDAAVEALREVGEVMEQWGDSRLKYHASGWRKRTAALRGEGSDG